MQTIQSQSEVNTDNWLTYTSEDKHFTIKYPSDLFIKEPIQTDDPYVMGRDTALIISDKKEAELQAIDPNEAVHIIISISKKKEGQTLQEGVYAMATGEKDSVSEIVVNGNKGYRIFSEENRTIPLTYFLEKDDQIYILIGVNYLEGDEQIESYKRMEEIYSTFDFL